jgi:hypothetical protein
VTFNTACVAELPAYKLPAFRPATTLADENKAATTPADHPARPVENGSHDLEPSQQLHRVVLYTSIDPPLLRIDALDFWVASTGCPLRISSRQRSHRRP